MPSKKIRLSESDGQKYNISKGLIGTLVASKDFAKAKEQYDKLFVFLKNEAKVPKAKIPEYKIDIDFVVMDGVRSNFSVEDVKRLVEHFEVRLPDLIHTSLNSKGRKEGHNFCARATDILHECWQESAENVKSLLEFFLAQGLSIESEFPYNDMLFNATTKYFVHHEFIGALLATGHLEVNRYMMIEDKVMLSAFSLSKSLGNVNLVSVFLESGADPNFLDVVVNSNKKLLKKMQEGKITGAASTEIARLSEDQRLESFSATDLVIEKFYLNKLRNLLDQLDADVVADQKGAESVGVKITQVIKFFEQYLLYKEGASQESMLLLEVQLNHNVETCILKYILSDLDPVKRDGDILDSMSKLLSMLPSLQVKNQYGNLFARLYHKLVVGLESFKLAIIRDFLDFKKEFVNEQTAHLDHPQESSLAAEDVSKKSDDTVDTVLDDEDYSLASPDSKPQEDEWDQLAEEIGKFNLEDDLDSTEGHEAYESGESEDEEETGLGMEMNPSCNFVVPGIWSSASLKPDWGSFSIVDHLDAKNSVEEELLQPSSEFENGGVFFGSEVGEVDDSLEPESALEEKNGFFGDMSAIKGDLLESSLIGDDRDEEKEINALEE